MPAPVLLGGERTLRHNAVRNVLYTWADRAGLQPERERGGLLLPQRPDELASYARLKAAHMDTAGACARQGVKFLPMVLESTGAWDPAAARVLWELARAAAAREGAQLLQDLCATVRTHQARAVLRRRSDPEAQATK